MDNQRVARGGRDPAALAREVIDANRYMTLATADGDGRPWASPVWYAHQGYTDLYWVSRPEARHSRNLAVRPEVSIVIFDSTVPEGTGRPSTSRRWPRSSTGPSASRGSRSSRAGPRPTEPTGGTSPT